MERCRWRTATLVVTVVAALEFVVLAGGALVLLGHPLSRHLRPTAAAAAAAPRPHATARPTAADAKLARSETSVMVLNGNGRAGAASAAADRVRALAYLVGTVGNANRSDYTHTLVMYRPGYAGEAARLASDLHVRVVSPLDGMRPAQLSGSHLVLIVGT